MLGLGSSLSTGGGASSEFSLDNISGLVLWLKNDTGVTAAQWDDSSGQDNHVVQTNSSYQGTVEDGGIAFPGNKNMDLTTKITLGSFTVFMSIEPDSGDSMSMIGDADGSDFIRINQTAANEFRSKRGVNSLDTTVSHSTDFSYEGNGGVERFIMMFRQEDDDTIDIGVNADIDSFSVANSTGSNMDFEHLASQKAGRQNSFVGTIYEVAIYDSNLSTADATSVRENMASRTGITL